MQAVGFFESVMGFRDDAERPEGVFDGTGAECELGQSYASKVVFSSEQGRPELSVHAALRWGWFFGS